MDWFYSLLTDTNSIAHTALIYAAIITLGLAVGRIKVKGISLGVIGVLFVGLFFAHLGARVDPDVLGFTRDFGLIIFIFFCWSSSGAILFLII